MSRSGSRGTPALSALRHASLFLKSVAVTVTVAFLGLYLQPVAMAARPSDVPKTISRTPANDERLAQHLSSIEKRLHELDQKLARQENILQDKEDFKRLRHDLDDLDREAIADFDQIERHIKDRKLPSIISDRHSRAIRSYQAEMAALKANLDALQNAKDDSDRGARARQASEHLKTKHKKRLHTSFDPKASPVRGPKFKERTPRTNKKDFAVFDPSVQVAAAGDVAGLLLSVAMLAAPTPEDLAETPEVQFSPDIQRLVTFFEQDPVRMYEFVRNNFVYEPYYGSVKGSQSTLLLQGGNDFDQASVLIALYRQAGIPARYVYGTVEIPVDKAMKWLGGITNPKVVGEALVSNGIPAKMLISGGTYKYVQLEHVWVEAYLPYDNYRGRINDLNVKKNWVPLDPSFKFHDVNPNAADLAAAQNFNADAFFSQYLQSLQPDTPSKEYLRRSIDYVTSNLPGQRVYDLLSSGPVQEKSLDLLPNTLPYPTKVIGNRFSRVPDALRHRVSIELGQANAPSLQYTATWMDLLHKRFTLSYEPATTSDAQTVASYGNLYDTPPYLVYVKPVLKIEGQSVAEGEGVPMAGDLVFRMAFTAANGEHQGEANNLLVAGAMQAIVLDAGYTNGRIVTDRTNKWNAAVIAGEQGDAVIGEFLNLFGVTYLQELDSSRKITSRTMKLLDTNHQAEAMVGVDLVVGYSFGVPRSVSIGGIAIDVDRNISVTLSADGDHAKARRFYLLDGLTSSTLEHNVFEKVLSEPTLPVQAVSAVKALQVASTQGIAVHNIDQSNIGSLLPTLEVDEAIKADIQNAVNVGMTAIVSARNVQINSWQGAGYILLDPATGAGYYRINGGLSGGSLTKKIASLEKLIKEKKITRDDATRIIYWFRHSIMIRFPTESVDIISEWNLARKHPKTGQIRCHDGADISVVVGTDVLAIADGEAVAKSDPTGFGTYVEIYHGLGVYSLYGHLSSVVSTGMVQEGQLIAKSGSTGLSEGPHVHFSIYLTSETQPLFKDGRYNCGASVNPRDFLWY